MGTWFAGKRGVRRLAARILIGLTAWLALGAAAPRGDLDAVVARARSEHVSFVVVVLVDAAEREESWARELIRRAGWREAGPEAAPSEPQDPAGKTAPLALVLHADRSRSVAARFGVTSFPQCVILDSEGREVGRVRGMSSPELVAGETARMLQTAEEYGAHLGALEENPRDVEALYWIGEYRWNRGERRLALEYFRRLVELGDSMEAEEGPLVELLASALYHVAEGALEAGDAESAELHYRKAMGLASDRETRQDVVFGLALCLTKQERTDEAIRLLEGEVKAGNDDAGLDRFLFSLGYLCLEAGDRASARRHFKACVARFSTTSYGRKAGRHLERLESTDVSASPPRD